MPSMAVVSAQMASEDLENVLVENAPVQDHTHGEVPAIAIED